jgi:DNA-binding transcriptional LysR family regulator
VHAQEIEAAFVAEPYNTAGLESQIAFLEEIVLITPKSQSRVRTPKDIGKRTVIAFANGCSYRRRLEMWLGAESIQPDRVMEFQSYHAIVACVAAGSGIAVVPRSVLEMTRASNQVNVTSLPALTAKAKTQLVWRPSHHSLALKALKALLVTALTLQKAA